MVSLIWFTKLFSVYKSKWNIMFAFPIKNKSHTKEHKTKTTLWQSDLFLGAFLHQKVKEKTKLNLKILTLVMSQRDNCEVNKIIRNIITYNILLYLWITHIIFIYQILLLSFFFFCCWFLWKLRSFDNPGTLFYNSVLMKNRIISFRMSFFYSFLWNVVKGYTVEIFNKKIV